MTTHDNSAEDIMTCDCCGGDLPPMRVWEDNRNGADDCTGSIDLRGRCRAFSRDELWVAADEDDGAGEELS